MSVLRTLWRLYAWIRYQMHGLLPPRRRDFRSCGDRVCVHHQVRFTGCDEISFDDEIYIGPRCQLFGHGGLHICSGVVLGENVTLIASNHRFEGDGLEKIPFDDEVGKKGIRIGRGVWIGQNAMVLPDVRLGEHSVVAAGSVVTKDTEAFGVYAGVPARLLRMRELPSDFDLERRPHWAASKPRHLVLY